MSLACRERRVLAFLALAVLVALAGCSFDPPNVCGVCGREVQATAGNHGVNLTAESSEVHVYLHGDGSAEWVERTELTDVGATELRENATLRNRVIERATKYRSAAPGTPDAVSVESGSLVVTYDVPNLAERYPGGVLVVDRFHRQRSGSSFGYEVESDRAVLHAPDGMVVTNRPPASRWNRSAVVWQSSVPAQTYVAFGPTQSEVPSWPTRAAIAVEVARWAAVPVAIGSLVSVSVLGFVVWMLLGRFGRREPVGASRSGLHLDDELGKRLAGVSVLLLLAAAVVVLVTSPDSFATPFWSFTVAAVLLFGVLGKVANGPRAVRWPVTVALVGMGPLLTLWWVLANGPGGTDYLGAGWSVVVSLVGAILFVVSNYRSSR